MHEAMPILQVVEISQRVMLNMCTVSNLLPKGLGIHRGMPIGGWFYRLFGREQGGWDVNGGDVQR